MNVTEPVTAAAAETVAVNDTGWPGVDGFGDEVNEVVVVALAAPTVWLTTDDVLLALFASPP